MTRIKLLFSIFFYFYTVCLSAQDITNFTQFFINPYSINPAYAGIEGRPAASLVYRRQWSGIKEGPSIANLSFHAPATKGINYGMNFTNDVKGILKTNAISATGGYTLKIDKNKFVSFGASVGAAFNAVDVAEFEDLNDPTLDQMLDQNAWLIGNAGVAFHLNTVHFGAALPNIFSPAYVSKDAFSVEQVNPAQSVIIHASNRFYFAKDKHVFEPYLIYRMNKDLPSQIEAAGVVHLNHVLWLGGSYKQDFGISALGGVKLQNFFLIGGSYSFKNTGANELNSPSFEIQLSYLFGARKKNVPVYSFVNTVKEKEKRKTAAQIAAEKRKAEEKKKADELAKKKQEEQKLAEAKKKEQEKAVPPEPLKEEPAVAPVAPVVTKQSGGPRFKSERPVFSASTYDTAHHEEQARLSKLDEHATDPDEHHGEDTNLHPNAERHEYIKQGTHKSELGIGNYIISGVFKSENNASHFAAGLKKLGFEANYGYLTDKNLWYVYISSSNDIHSAQGDRDKFRKMKLFKDCWLLTVYK